MIQANELRIGNWVHDYTTGKNEKIEGDLLYAIDILQNGAENDFNPIPLTPEILEKAGLPMGNFEVEYKLVGVNDERNSFSYYKTDLVEVEYVHQLQNLYFALTGEELEINL